MPTATRTINPLPFEHLEPKRFEDLVRQLAYDFRRWQQLEPTGRAGSDEGFDIRGVEAIGGPPPEEIEEPEHAEPSTRLWLIQCKREQEIGPTKLRRYLDAIPQVSARDLHGLIIAAPCIFSKRAADILTEWCNANGVREWYLWGRPSIEDMLFAPQNDHLLFAYFGLSLQIRRQRAATGIRRMVSLKRRLKAALGNSEGGFGTTVVLRDPADSSYPITSNERLEGSGWLPVYSKGIGVRGLRIVARRFFCYFDLATTNWDIASGVRLEIPDRHTNPWHGWQTDEDYEQRLHQARLFASSLPRENQATFILEQHIPYENIIEIDDVGDNVLKSTTVFTSFVEGKPPFAREGKAYIRIGSTRHVVDREMLSEKHVRVFPADLRDIQWEEQWFKRNGLRLSLDSLQLPTSEAGGAT